MKSLFDIIATRLHLKHLYKRCMRIFKIFTIKQIRILNHVRQILIPKVYSVKTFLFQLMFKLEYNDKKFKKNEVNISATNEATNSIQYLQVNKLEIHLLDENFSFFFLYNEIKI